MVKTAAEIYFHADEVSLQLPEAQQQSVLCEYY
jgi:hypothetical protein